MDREHIGEEFQQATKHGRSKMAGRGLDWASRPPTYKTYPGAARSPLPSPARPILPFDEALKNRKSVREFSDQPLALEELSYLLWASTGIRESRGGHDFRTAPSAGALYPIETYVVVNLVNGVDAGIYHYDIKGHALELLRKGDLGEEVAHAALEQDMCAHAPVVVIWTGIFERSRWKYGQRAYRYVYLDAGHVAANLALSAAALGLGSCQVAATFDDEVNRLLSVDGVGESVLYMSVLGRPAPPGPG
jgi:SagB-type dehydrogenase family enzyme